MANKKQDAANIEDAPLPNLIFVGHKINRQPIESFTDGSDKITLPKADEQIKVVAPEKVGEPANTFGEPFYHEQATRVVSCLGSRLYKHFDGTSAAGEKKD